MALLATVVKEHQPIDDTSSVKCGRQEPLVHCGVCWPSLLNVAVEGFAATHVAVEEETLL